MGKKIDNLFAADFEPKETEWTNYARLTLNGDSWNWPVFPRKLRLFIYHGIIFPDHRITFPTVNNAHALLYGFDLMNMAQVLGNVQIGTFSAADIMALESQKKNSWWHRFMQKVAGV